MVLCISIKNLDNSSSTIAIQKNVLYLINKVTQNQNLKYSQTSKFC